MSGVWSRDTDSLNSERGSGCNLKCLGIGRSCLPRNRMRGDIIKTKCWNIDYLKFIEHHNLSD